MQRHKYYMPELENKTSGAAPPLRAWIGVEKTWSSTTAMCLNRSQHTCRSTDCVAAFLGRHGSEEACDDVLGRITLSCSGQMSLRMCSTTPSPRTAATPHLWEEAIDFRGQRRNTCKNLGRRRNAEGLYLPREENYLLGSKQV